MAKKALKPIWETVALLKLSADLGELNFQPGL